VEQVPAVVKVAAHLVQEVASTKCQPSKQTEQTVAEVQVLQPEAQAVHYLLSAVVVRKNPNSQPVAVSAQSAPAEVLHLVVVPPVAGEAHMAALIPPQVRQVAAPSAGFQVSIQVTAVKTPLVAVQALALAGQATQPLVVASIT
jgi:hypothetical protein